MKIRFTLSTIIGGCALLSLLMPFEQTAFADTITFVDSNDFISATYTGASVAAAGGTVSGVSACNGTGGQCIITITPPTTIFSSGGYKDFNIFSGDELPNSLADTLVMAGPPGSGVATFGLVLTWTSDFNEVLLNQLAGGQGAATSSVPNTLLYNGFTFGTTSFGPIPVIIQFQRTENDTAAVSPEPSTALLIPLGFAGVMGVRLHRRRRANALVSWRQSHPPLGNV